MHIHSGAWWPVFVPDFYGPRCSQHPFDPYSFVHILHGIVFFGLWGSWPLFVFKVGALLAPDLATATVLYWWTYLGGPLLTIMLAVSWEMLENSDFIIDRYRKTTGTSTDYEGDSYQNSLGDILCAEGGYWMTLGCVLAGVWYVPVIWLVVTEVVLALLIRDGLALTIVQLMCFSERIKAWQEKAVHKSKASKPQEDSALISSEVVGQPVVNEG